MVIIETMNHSGAIAGQITSGTLIIIARSFVLVYAIVALLITSGVFSPGERRALIGFFVLSPLIFMIILYLFGKHHLDVVDQKGLQRG